MAEFTREKAKILEVYQRQMTASGKDKYIRLPFNLITYDDASGQYIEPVSLHPPGFTWYDKYTDATDPDWLITDVVPFQGVTEIR